MLFILSGNKMKREIRFWFTLVEILIVVVIIGILSTAVLPKLTGYLEKTRDIKRQADLQNIATAILSYKNHNGYFPLRTVEEQEINTIKGMIQSDILIKTSLPHRGGVKQLKEKIWTYISEIPSDPQKNSRVKIYHDFYFRAGKEQSLRWKHVNSVIKPWEYIYQTLRKGDEIAGGAILIAKTETADHSNYVLLSTKGWKESVHPNWGLLIHPGWFYTQGIPAERSKIWNTATLKLCDSISKGEKGQEKFAKNTDGIIECIYSSEEQLYYIYIIE